MLYYVNIPLLVDFIIEKTSEIKGTIAGIASIISIFTVFKIRFFDARTIKKLEKVYGKQKVIDVLSAFLELSNYLTIEEIVERVLRFDKLVPEMKHEIKKLHDILFRGEEEASRNTARYPRAAKKELKREIRKLLKVIDKRIEVEIVEREREYLSAFGERFKSAVRVAAARRRRLDEVDDAIRKRGKEKLALKK